MTVFEFSCPDCGSFEVIPVRAVRRRVGRRPPLRCPHCSGPVSVDVLYDFEPSDDAWFSSALGTAPKNIAPTSPPSFSANGGDLGPQHVVHDMGDP